MERDYADLEAAESLASFWEGVAAERDKLRERVKVLEAALRGAVYAVAGSPLVSIGSINNTHSCHIGVAEVARWRAVLEG